MPSSTLVETDIATLRDGTQVAIRPLGRADREALSAAFERFGPASRQQRFFSAVSRLTESQLRYLTEVDQRKHVALAAVDVTDPTTILGVARFVRLDGGRAEPAIAIVDERQGSGLGTVLMTALVACARELGVSEYQAVVLPDNEPVLRLLHRLGRVCVNRSGSTLDVTVDLRTDAAVTRLHDAPRASHETGGEPIGDQHMLFV